MPIHRFLLPALSLLLVAQTWAKPASSRAFARQQPDGTVLTILQRGNESLHFALSPDGHFLLPDSSGVFHYANTQGTISPWKAHDPARRTPEESAFLAGLDDAEVFSALKAQAPRKPASPSAARSAAAASVSNAPHPSVTKFASTPKMRGLVLLVQFSDSTFTVPNPKAEYTKYMNQAGYSGYGMSGSVRDYFIATSDSAFQPDFDVYGPVTLSKPAAYYGGNAGGGSGQDSAIGTMVTEACKKLDASIDFSKYDNDGDGKVDFVYVFYAGSGEADHGAPESIWPQAGYADEFTLDGKIISRYAVSNERSGSAAEQGKFGLDGIGTFCHEFGHVLGLQDLYSTDGAESFSPTTWDLMDVGVYNCSTSSTYGISSCTPPLLSAFERWSLGWIRPDTLKASPRAQALHPLSSNQAFLLPSSRNSEYFLLENRQQKGWDTALPGHGLLIWHIDYDSAIWYQNAIGNTPSHQYVDLEEADGILTSATLSGDAFPGTGALTSFTKFTTWGGSHLSPSLYGIVETDGTICFSTDSSHKTIRCADTLPATTSLTKTGKKVPSLSLNRGTLSVTNPGHAALQLQVIAPNGRRLRTLEIADETTRLTLSSLVPHGLFLLRLTDKGALVEQRTVALP